MDPSVLPFLPYLPPLPYSYLFCSISPSCYYLGHRSPPPHIRDTQSSYRPQAPQASVPNTHIDSTSRQSSRFDRPANTLQQSSRSRTHDVYMPADSMPQKREPEPELTSAQVSAEHSSKRKRPAEEPIHGRGAAPAVDAPVPIVPPERPTSGSSSSHTEQSRTYSTAFDYSVLHKPMFVYVIFRSLTQANGRDSLSHLRAHDFAKCHARIKHPLLPQFQLAQGMAQPVLSCKDLLTQLTVIFLQAHDINLNFLFETPIIQISHVVPAFRPLVLLRHCPTEREHREFQLTRHLVMMQWLLTPLLLRLLIGPSHSE
jgi:hypothetical protein